VRHPIYTGILLAVYATAALKGTVLGLAGAAVITTGLWMKARLEEGFLREELGPDYDAYRKRVPMLLPFGPKSACPRHVRLRAKSRWRRFARTADIFRVYCGA